MTTLSSISLQQAERTLGEHLWPRLAATRQQVFERVLQAFIRHRVGEEHFYSVTGYGHDDLGREVTDKVFADALQAEVALVRPHFASGTHAIAVALRGCLNPGKTLLSITGKPYDTLEEVIGIRENHPQSLKNQGVTYGEISIFEPSPDGPDSSRPFLTRLDFTEAEAERIRQADVVFIQRSRGYSLRPSLGIGEIEVLIHHTKALNPRAIVIVDNCYGEFTEASEPPAVGADLIAGSLIKNPGGGIVPAGGYVAGREDLVEACAQVLTCPGVGREGGYTFDLTRLILQGLYLAPGVVHEALKGMSLAAYLFDQAGYTTLPRWDAVRSDIIQVIHLQEAERLINFCKVIQSVSPVNSHLTPVPAALPGYHDPVVMAGGTFIEGSTIELSADGPIRQPYTVFLQGGLTYSHTRYALGKALSELSL